MTKVATRAADELAKNRLDARLDEALAETFPASDPIAVSPIDAPTGGAGSGVRDNATAHRFELGEADRMAVAHYELTPGRIIFTHTETPAALRGQGVASALIRGALDEARRRGLKVVAACAFVADFIGRHAEYRDLLA